MYTYSCSTWLVRTKVSYRLLFQGGQLCVCLQLFVAGAEVEEQRLGHSLAVLLPTIYMWKTPHDELGQLAHPQALPCLLPRFVW